MLIAFLKGDAIVKPCNPSIRLVGLGLESTKDLPRAFLALRALFAEFNPDVVHSHLVHANILTRLLKLAVPIPRLITTAHNKNEEGRLRMLAYRLTDRLADLSTNVSDEAVAAFIEQKAVKIGRMITVHNGISSSEFCFRSAASHRIRDEFRLSSTTKLIVAVGRLCEPKDYPNLLYALSKLKPDSPSYIVLISGDGPLRSHLTALAIQLGLIDRVLFLGVRSDVPDLLSAADIFVLASAWEGFPLVVGEAMACECMVVATDCGGVKEFVGNTGMLAPPKDPGALARKLEAALALTDDERADYGMAARVRVKQLYSLDAAVDKWLSIYQNPSVILNGADAKAEMPRSVTGIK